MNEMVKTIVKTKEMIQFLDELHYSAQNYDFEKEPTCKYRHNFDSTK